MSLRVYLMRLLRCNSGRVLVEADGRESVNGYIFLVYTFFPSSSNAAGRCLPSNV